MGFFQPSNARERYVRETAVDTFGSFSQRSVPVDASLGRGR